MPSIELLAATLMLPTAIETDLLRIQANILRDRGLGRFPERLSNAPPPILGIPACNTRDREEANDSSAPQADGSHSSHAPRQRAQPVSSALRINRRRQHQA
jgi:hypothetical protein